jgi:hypothetical protein
MSKFNRPGAYTAHSPVTTTQETTTYEGGAAWLRDEKSELVMLAVVNMANEDTFYESAQKRDSRYAVLVRMVAVSDPKWFLSFVTWLRGEANMRSASLIAAAEGVKARLYLPAFDSLLELTGVNRQIVAAPLLRPDEPGEFLAYWTQKFGRNIPQPVKRGVADAVRRLYTERSLLKYDTASHAWRFGDVIDVVHPAPADDRRAWQGDLFKHALDRRHGHDLEIPDSLRMVRNNLLLRAAGPASREWLDPEVLQQAGMTWEDVLSAQGGTMNKAKLWEAMIPSMGYMALLRNLRNFDEAGVSDDVAAGVCERLADPAQVAGSRQFPFRFLSAYRAAPSDRWGHALGKALHHACSNVPEFKGRTLVLVDTSGSMERSVSARSVIRHVDVGALFGVALAVRGADVDLVGFADGSFRHPLVKGASVLRQAEAFTKRVGEVGHGTETVAALRGHLDGHDRVVIVSDMQAFRDYGWAPTAGRSVSEAVPANIPVFGINTTGYAQTSIDTSKPNRYEIGGFSDKLFTMIDLLGRGRDAAWPWEA